MCLFEILFTEIVFEMEKYVYTLYRKNLEMRRSIVLSVKQYYQTSNTRNLTLLKSNVEIVYFILSNFKIETQIYYFILSAIVDVYILDSGKKKTRAYIYCLYGTNFEQLSISYFTD